jgi:hypothetical protein
MLSFWRELFAELPYVLAFDRLCRKAGVENKPEPDLLDQLTGVGGNIFPLPVSSDTPADRERQERAKVLHQEWWRQYHERQALDLMERELELEERRRKLLERKREFQAQLPQP